MIALGMCPLFLWRMTDSYVSPCCFARLRAETPARERYVDLLALRVAAVLHGWPI